MLSAHVARTSSPNLVIAWVHEDTLAPQIAKALSTPEAGCDFFHVRGSSVDVLTDSAYALKAKFSNISGMRYHQVVLGFKVSPHGSRWLTHSEISRGVLDAVTSPQELALVGVVEPWSRRP